MKQLFSVASMVAFIVSLCFVSCSSPINTINDPHFEENGIYLDSLGAPFQAIMPTSLDFYVEVSGSMNGFFRANKATAFKTDVWAIVSSFGSPGVSVLSNTGTQATKYTGDQFRSRMNSGGFVSTTETQVPAMLENILSKLDYDNGAVAVLISDMKYSPVGSRALPVLLQQYATDISNIVGKDVCVAKVRNCITTILSDRDNYLDNIETGFDYKRPAYGFGVPDNVIQLDNEPTFYNYDVSYSDTCKVVLNLDLSDFRWLIASDEDVLRECIKVKAAYGSEIEVGKIAININNHNQKKLERLAIASVELKLWNMPMDADVIEWTLDHPEYSVTDTFMQIQNAAAEADLTGSFSLANFIQGVFQAVQNHWNQEPNRILISKSN